MIITFLLVSAALLVLAFLLWAARGQSQAIADLQDLPQQTKPVDVAAFRNLIDPGEEEFLRANLSGREFRLIQKQRTLAAIAYVRCAAHNASVLLRLGEVARRHPDPRVAAAAQQLVNRAVRLRIFAVLALMKLYPATVVPGARISPKAVLDAYQQLTSVVAQLTRLQHPARTIRITAAL
jgi:hypothetical protein